MYCKVRDCLYNESETCGLDETEINENGECEWIDRKDESNSEKPNNRKDEPQIYGNEHNCIMTIFGECSYKETGCGDCAVVEKVRKALEQTEPQKSCSTCGYSSQTPSCDTCEGYSNWWLLEDEPQTNLVLPIDSEAHKYNARLAIEEERLKL